MRVNTICQPIVGWNVIAVMTGLDQPWRTVRFLLEGGTTKDALLDANNFEYLKNAYPPEQYAAN